MKQEMTGWQWHQLDHIYIYHIYPTIQDKIKCFHENVQRVHIMKISIQLLEIMHRGYDKTQPMCKYLHHNHHHNHFTAFFRDHPGEAVPE